MPSIDSLTLRVQAEQIANAYLPNGGRPSMTSDADTVQVLLAAIAEGNYRETACKLAGISKVTFYNTLKRAEAGEPSAVAFVNALEKAEACAENELVNNVRRASQLPQFWAAGMTLLERKSPEKWGRRQDSNDGPKVLVQIGVSAGDVQVTIGEGHHPHTPIAQNIE